MVNVLPSSDSFPKALPSSIDAVSKSVNTKTPSTRVPLFAPAASITESLATLAPNLTSTCVPLIALNSLFLCNRKSPQSHSTQRIKSFLIAYIRPHSYTEYHYSYCEVL